MYYKFTGLLTKLAKLITMDVYNKRTGHAFGGAIRLAVSSLHLLSSFLSQAKSLHPYN